ncbi:MAG: RagB/SusD family nutrient uptake outer membrane protein [Duncaniella sp.]|nr:RagB/SusD family nutrient uptake outer membrane protein [Duncaniella sp.]
MKSKILAALALSSAAMLSFTSCIEEVQPNGSSVTTDQLQSSPTAGISAIAAIPSMILYCGSDNTDRHCDIGYAGMMIMRDRMTGDMCINPNGTNYDQYGGYAQNKIQSGYWFPQLITLYLGKLVLTCNKAAEAYPETVEDDYSKGARAVALTYRALAYLDCARWFEYLPCDATSPITAAGNDVTGLTYPIVTEKTTQEEARNNPRAPRAKMAEFILSDLDYAEANIQYRPEELDAQNYGNLAVVYGLKARLYMWIEDYANAKKYADLAIAESGKTPLTEAQWTDPKTGFNTPANNNSWMLSCQLVAENRAVTTGICNFTSFLSPEPAYTYAAAGACFTPDADFYKRINNSDFRKLSWVPTSILLLGKVQINGVNTNPDKLKFSSKYKYCSIKFRPVEGNLVDYTVASASALPLMRVEEMHFISIEAAAHLNAAEGKQALVNFMKTYRYPSYNCKVSSQEDVVEEIVFQKRVEFWGEGQTLWDIKRLNYSVTRGYKNTNWYAETRFNTNGRPAWTNMVFLDTEEENNAGVRGWNNPNTEGVYEQIPDSDVNFDKGKW